MVTPDSKTEIDRDLTQSRTAWETIVRYAFTANGTALGLSVGALSKITGTVPMAQIGKGPLVIYLAGLMLAGLNLIFSYCLCIWSAREKVENKIEELKNEHETLKLEIESSLMINTEFAKISNRLQSMIDTMKSVRERDPALELAQVKMAAEIMVLLSYCAFFFGTILVIWRI